jgi:hypothetical protein
MVDLFRMENPNAGLHGIIQAYCNRFPSIIRTLSTPRAWGQAPRGHESAIRVLFIETSTILGLVEDILLVATFPPQLSRSNGRAQIKRRARTRLGPTGTARGGGGQRRRGGQRRGRGPDGVELDAPFRASGAAGRRQSLR